MPETILSIVGVDKADHDLQTALDICGEINAHLVVLIISLALPPPIGSYTEVVSDAWLRKREVDRLELDERVRNATDLLNLSGLSYEVVGQYLDVAWADDRLGDRARYADLTIAGPELLADGSLKDAVLSGCLFQSGRPMLLVPDKSKPTLRPKKVLLAWDSRMEAARAVGCALPMMRAAESVCIAMVDPVASALGSGDEPGADIAAYLARHGVRVTVDQLASCGHPTVEVLNQHAIDMSADLIVMGAYGHSRMRERIFGGATRGMIEGAQVPVLMVH